jgi:Protein of unknown function (DUF4013)
MASTVSLEGVKKAVFFPFQGKDWGTKMAIGGALNFANFVIPLVPLIALLGYTGQVMKVIITRDEDPQLPEWKDWGVFFLDGIKMFGVLVLYNLPGILVIAFGYFLMFFLNFGLSFFGGFLSVATSNGNSPSVVPYLITILGSMLGTFGGILCMWIGFILLLLAMLFFPPAMGNMLARGSFGAAFRVREWWPILKANITGYLLALAFTLGLTFMLVFVMQFLYMTVILCILLPFVISFMGFFIAQACYSLFAVAYRDGVRMLARSSG